MAGRAADRRLVFFFAVAVNAPTHRETRVLIHRFHRLNRAVTLVAGLRSSVFFNVALVIELHVIGKHVNLLPGDRRVGVVRFRDFLDFRFVGCNNQVAVHADIQTWNGRVVRAFSRRVTVQTLHFVLAGV